MSSTTTDGAEGSAATSGGAKRVQQIESGLIALLCITGIIVLAPQWWWIPLAAFLLFDLSMLGYLRSPALGAISYNAVHTYAWPAVLGGIALATSPSSPAVSMWCAIIALTWAFHVGVDRALGYGLKLPDAFTHTHLGWIGRPATTAESTSPKRADPERGASQG